MWHSASTMYCGLWLFLLLEWAVALPALPGDLNRRFLDHDLPHINITEHYGASMSPRSSLERRAKDFYLRIMPLGASITKGEPAPPDDQEKNGYRKPLRDRLREDGWEVNMVGSVEDWGTMSDRQNEGHPGWRISEIHSLARDTVRKWKPNLILINAGTNDATQNRDTEPASESHIRMEKMITELFSIVPETTIILSTLLPHSSTPEAAERIKAMNQETIKLVKKLEQVPGYRISLANMDDGFITLGDIFDGTHPTLLGRRKMAAVWHEAINRAEGNITRPSSDVDFDDGASDTTCDKKYGSGNAGGRAGWQVLGAADPLISDDGTYTHKSTPRGKLDHPIFWPETTKFYFTQLVNQGADRGGELDELVIAALHESGSRTISMAMNRGDGTFDEGVKLDISDGCIPRGIRWGDIDNDGLDDFICIAPDGAMFVSRNMGGNPPKFESLGQARGPTLGYKQEHVRLGDIDGDGRLDYCVVGDDGNIRCWRNGGVGKMPEYWQDMGSGQPVFLAKGMGDIRGVRFVDVNGDNRDDWVWIDTTGKTRIFINQRGEGKGMIPHWVEAAAGHGGGFDVKDDGSRDLIQFGRLYGSGRADYAFIDKSGCRKYLNTQMIFCTWDINVWENQGSGGKFQKGDGAYWGDMRGRGVDDYIWISPNGVVNVFPNQNTKEDTTKDATRGIWGVSIRALETGMDRRALHIGDWDGDGKDDVIGVDKASGALTVWYSRWNGGTDFKFDRKSIEGSDKCKQRWGVGYFDNGHHFADITGEGRVDYLCMEPDGRVTGWMNDKDSTLRSVGQVKFSEELDRANFRFADVDGDGRADLIWTDKFTGDGKVWKNMRELPENERMSGSKFHWDPKGALYLGSSRGPNLHFPNLGGQGRADMVEVNPVTAHGWAWYNMCTIGGGDDAESDPNLPEYTPAPPEDDPEVPDDEADAFCDSNASLRNPALWNELGMGTWLEQRTRYYANSEEGWPRLAENEDGGVPRVMAWFNLRTEDRRLNWPGQKCQDITGECSLDSSDYLDNCHGRGRRSFALWTMANYAHFRQLHAETITIEGLNTALKLPLLSTTFINSKYGSDLSMGAGAWLTLAAGFATTISAVAIPATGPIGAFFGGLLTVASAIAGSSSDPTFDPRFDTWAQLSADFGKAQEMARDMFAAQYNKLLRDMPPDHDEKAGTELALLLKSGAFASQDIGTGSTEIDTGVQRRMLTASLITAMWNSQRVFAVKFGKDKVKFKDNRDNDIHYDPCFGKGIDENVAKHEICFDENTNWLIIEHPKELRDDGDLWRNFGQDAKSLDTFDFTPEQVIRSAERTQQQTGGFKSTDPNTMADYLLSIGQDPNREGFDIQELVRFNIPVCDMDKLDLEAVYCTPSSHDWCIFQAIIRTCEGMYLSETVGWPYKLGDD
ncbi:putative carbohydrate esterase family 3 protein [Colletotrichum karsti]|uniref:Carbohydrate esterase family 3 protein n=1 Tax=Colletotrichum karsti TaxID=1095194 RepID=A0A9P6LQC1_9PEZI|nr:putative carbohydrate esterase family 3 protein [Colletotrichum karsti]KAF9880547.1 putative carbohydrate esterase family 3 protein [Colletotrichum karsti]